MGESGPRANERESRIMTTMTERTEIISFLHPGISQIFSTEPWPHHGGRESVKRCFFFGRVNKRQGSSPNFGIERTRSCLNSTLIVPDLYVYDVENLFKNVANIPENYRINKRYAMNEIRKWSMNELSFVRVRGPYPRVCMSKR